MVNKNKLIMAGAMLFVMVAVAFMPVATSNGTTKPSDYHHCGDILTVDIMAGQSTDAGDIIVSNNKETLYVEYKTASPWYLIEIHLDVETALANIPQTKKGNPIPGQFEYSVSFSNKETYYIFEIDWTDFGLECGNYLYIAAHCVVRKDTCTGYDEQTGWGNGLDFPGKNWAMYFKYKIQCCKVPSIPTDVGYWIKNPGTDCYWDAKITLGADGNVPGDTRLNAWCVDTGHTINGGSHSGTLSLFTWTNYEKVNWILNNKDSYSWEAIQAAIWYFVEGILPKNVHVNGITMHDDDIAAADELIDASEAIDHFCPTTGQVVAVLVTHVNTGTETGTHQKIIIEIDP